MPVYKYDMSVHRFACQSCSMCVCVWVACPLCGKRSFIRKIFNLSSFSSSTQSQVKPNPGCCLCLCLCLSSTGLSLYISSGCLLPLLYLLSLLVSFSPLFCLPLACVPTCPILSLFLMLFICPSSACIFLQHVASSSSFCSPVRPFAVPVRSFSNNSCCSCVGRRADDEGSTWPSSLSSRVRHF